MDHSEADSARRYYVREHSITARRVEPGLHIVSTPIGNLQDITLRALETLAACDLIACEDTRVTGVLLQRYGIRTQMLTYHEHNALKQRPKILEALEVGKAVALVSDAGTPLISDPGFRLVGDVVEQGHKVVPVPGASAMLSGLVGAGLPSDTILFAGFLPNKTHGRKKRLEELKNIPATLVFYESPHRVGACLADMVEVLGKRTGVVARELTKRFETFERGNLEELREKFSGERTKGEIVILVSPPEAADEAQEGDVDQLLLAAIQDMPVSAAAKKVSKATGMDRKVIYARAMELKNGGASNTEPEDS